MNSKYHNSVYFGRKKIEFLQLFLSEIEEFFLNLTHRNREPNKNFNVKIYVKIMSEWHINIITIPNLH